MNADVDRSPSSVEAGRKAEKALKPRRVSMHNPEENCRSREKSREGIETAGIVRRRMVLEPSKQGEKPRRH